VAGSPIGKFTTNRAQVMLPIRPIRHALSVHLEK